MVKKNPWIEEKREANKAKNSFWVRKSERPEHRRAHKAVREAVKAGKIEKKPCEMSLKDCEGEEATSYFHHTDLEYKAENDLVGLWVCFSCHQRLHQLAKARAARQEARREAEKYQDSPGVIVLDD